MARPSKLTRQLQETICDALRKGASLVDACKLAGVAESTVHEWIARGRGRDRRRGSSRAYRAFSDAVERAIPQTRVEKGEIAGTSEFAEWAAEEFPDASRDRARARGAGAVTAGLMDAEF
jgi:transposase